MCFSFFYLGEEQNKAMLNHGEYSYRNSGYAYAHNEVYSHKPLKHPQTCLHIMASSARRTAFVGCFFFFQ
jgi:hypothetical protein